MFRRNLPFQLLELLGEGGQGSVYKALRVDREGGLKQTVALKILHSKTAVDLWRHEFESLSRVRSPYCVQVFSFERYQGRPALVLEYVEGVSLAVLAKTFWLEDGDILELLAQLEAGLKDLHRFGVVHGDLTPQNILVDHEGRIRVLDFGLANSKTLRMTPGFAAPERMAGEPASAAGDLFSLGKIEEFLRFTEPMNSNYLKVLPAERRFQDLSPSEARKTELAEKVKRFLERQHIQKNLATQTQNAAPQRRTWRSQAFVLASITSLLVLCLPQASHSVRPKPFAILNFRTSHWTYIFLDEQPLGYAPLNVAVEANQSHRLRWISAKGEGHREIRVEPQKTIHFEDSDFSH